MSLPGPLTSANNPTPAFSSRGQLLRSNRRLVTQQHKRLLVRLLLRAPRAQDQHPRTPPYAVAIPRPTNHNAMRGIEAIKNDRAMSSVTLITTGYSLDGQGCRAIFRQLTLEKPS